MFCVCFDIIMMSFGIGSIDFELITIVQLTNIMPFNFFLFVFQYTSSGSIASKILMLLNQ